jgi:hypothetical protein
MLAEDDAIASEEARGRVTRRDLRATRHHADVAALGSTDS